MKINEGIKKFNLSNPNTYEDLEERYSANDGKVLLYGDKVLVAGYYFNGMKRECYYAAVYEFLEDGHDCDDFVGLREVSDVEFEDEGHAIAWALKEA